MTSRISATLYYVYNSKKVDVNKKDHGFDDDYYYYDDDDDDDDDNNNNNNINELKYINEEKLDLKNRMGAAGAEEHAKISY